MTATVIVTAAGEPKGVARAVAALVESASAVVPAPAILLVAPDAATMDAGLAAGAGRVEGLRDPGLGKIRALRLAIERTRSDALVFTDGDVVVAPEALGRLLVRLDEPGVGCVAARPVPAEGRSALLGEWANLLFEAADRMRRETDGRGGVVEPSGYLFAVRRLPAALLSPSGFAAEDCEVAHRIAAAGFRCVYEPGARVVVRNPATLADWFAQKTRNARGHILSARFARRRRSRPMQSFRGELGFALRHALGRARGEGKPLRVAGLALARGAVWSWARLTLGSTERRGHDRWRRIESTKDEG